MIKYFCDICKKEIEPDEAGARPVFEQGRLMVNTMRAVDKTWNAGQVCVDCIRRCVQEGKVDLRG